MRPMSNAGIARNAEGEVPFISMFIEQDNFLTSYLSIYTILQATFLITLRFDNRR